MFSVCQAISIAITTVFPLPVAIFVAEIAATPDWMIVCLPQPIRDPSVAELVRYLGDIDHGFQRFELQSFRSRSGSFQCSIGRAVVGVTPRYPPNRHCATRSRIRLTRSFSCNRSAVRSCSASCFPFFFGAAIGTRGAPSSSIRYRVGNPIIIEVKMPGWFS